MENIKYSRQVEAIGRNGLMKQMGMSIMRIEGLHPNTARIYLEPITSKGFVGNGCVTIPIEDVPSVIKALTKFLPSVTLDPTL